MVMAMDMVMSMVDTMEVITMAKEQRMVMDMDMVMVMEVTMEATTMARDQLPKMTPPTTSSSQMVTSGTWKNTTNNLHRKVLDCKPNHARLF